MQKDCVVFVVDVVGGGVACILFLVLFVFCLWCCCLYAVVVVVVARLLVFHVSMVMMYACIYVWLEGLFLRVLLDISRTQLVAGLCVLFFIFCGGGVGHQVVYGRLIGHARRKDFAIINFTTRDAAKECIKSMNGTEFMKK